MYDETSDETNGPITHLQIDLQNVINEVTNAIAPPWASYKAKSSLHIINAYWQSLAKFCTHKNKRIK